MSKRAKAKQSKRIPPKPRNPVRASRRMLKSCRGFMTANERNPAND